MWVGKFALSPEGLPAGGVAWVDLGATAASSPAVVNGAAYHPTYSSADGISALYVTTEAVAAADTNIGGFRYRSDGALRVYDATSAVPAGSNTNQGIALTSDGQLCYTTGNTTSFNLNGVAVDSSRRVYAAPLAFELQFADAGSGVVSTVEAIGAITPTFTRATTATTVLSTGLIGSVASGSPRSYYDPTSLTYLGYLAEGARTNLCIQSEDLGTSWTPVRSSVSANAATSPDGSATADKLVEDSTAASTHLIQSTAATVTDGGTLTASVFFKAGGRNWALLNISDGGENAFQIYFNIATGVAGTSAVGGTGTFSSNSIKAYPGGWYRCSITGGLGAGVVSSLLSLFTATADATNSYDGDGSSGIFAWGAQLEQAAFASSYIPTTTVAVARNADVLTYPTAGWLNAAAGTLFSQAQVLIADAGTTRAIFFVSDGTTNEFIAQRVNAGSAQILVVTDGGVAQATLFNGTPISATTFLMAGAYAANDFAGSYNGGTVQTDASGTLPTVTTAYIGGGAVLGSLNGPIRRVSYYAARLANATLQGLTT